MREFRTSGSVEGAVGNHRPYSPHRCALRNSDQFGSRCTRSSRTGAPRFPAIPSHSGSLAIQHESYCVPACQVPT